MTSLAAIVKNLELALGTESEEIVSIFVDGIFVISKSFNDHIKHLSRLFEKHLKASLVIYLAKCEFIKSEIKFLGHIINADSI